MAPEPAEPATAKKNEQSTKVVVAAPAQKETEKPITVEEPAPETESRAVALDDPGKLLASANAASGPARNAWLAFLGLLAYLLVTLAGVSHVDLLLNSPVTLPIVNVKIPLFSFFLAAPFLFLLVHLGLLVQHAMLAHKYQHFSAAIAASEKGQAGDHPDRRFVHNYVFSQVLAGPKPPWPLQMLMRLMVFVTLSLLPVVVLLYFQIKFLPSHDVATTHAHRIAILLDLALLFIVRPFIAMPYLRPLGKKLSLGNQSWRWEISYASLGVAGSLCLVVLSFSLLVATVPQACFWPSGKRTEEQEKGCFSLDGTTAQWWGIKVESGTQTRAVFAPTKWLFEGKIDRTSGTPESPFSRNLIVTDKNLVAKKDFEEGETSLPLRGRDLRFAVLDRSDLRRADLFGSDLRGLSAIATRLDHAGFTQARMQGANLGKARMQGANLFRVEMQGAGLVRAEMQGANLSVARMQGADLGVARMQGADLREARMQGAHLGKAELQGADLRRAQMQGADLRLAQMQGANLSGARMQGANLRQARMQGADLRQAEMQGAGLRRAQMQGADLRQAEMQGAGLRRAQMQGADLRRARMQGADLRQAGIWLTAPPGASSLELAMPLDSKAIAPLGPDGKSKLEKLITEAKDETLRERSKKRLGPLLDTAAAQGWESSADRQFWSDFSSHSRPDPAELSNYLAELACSDRSGGYIIEGIVRRVFGFAVVYAKPTAARLIDKESCPAAKHLSKETRENLKRIAAPEKTEAEPRPVK